MKYVRLWLAEQHIYVLKYETNWRGRWQYAQGGTYRRLRHLSLPETIEDVWQMYGLQNYTPSLVVSGRDVLWQPLSLVAASRDKARDLLTWEGESQRRFQDYAFDVQCQAQDGHTQWYVGAYRKEMRDAVQKGIDSMGIPLTTIDVLPALVSRWCQAVTGCVYVPDGDVYYQIQLRQGIPWSYGLTDAIPCDVAGTDEALLFQDETRQWSTCTGTDTVRAKMERWQLTLPEGLLVAL